VERGFLADDDLAGDESFLERDLVQVLEEMGLAGTEVAGDQEAGGGEGRRAGRASVAAAPADRSSLRRSPWLDVAMVRHRFIIGRFG
jgi:hypothetical protein